MLNKRRSSLIHQAELQQVQYKDTKLFATRVKSALAKISASLTSPRYGFFWLLLKRAGLPQIRFHDLRHTAATLLLGKAVHPNIVQEMLGHSTITQTIDTYSHVLPDLDSNQD